MYIFIIFYYVDITVLLFASCLIITFQLSDNAKQRKVPSSRIGRMVSFGTLAAGLGIGTAAEYTKRALGIGDHTAAENLFMNKANMERIVDTLCKVRGAALKLGQIMSIQDESIVNPELAQALERVRKSADFMPTWQLEEVSFCLCFMKVLLFSI